MKSLQKQLCGIAVLIFGLIVTVIGTGVGNVLSLIGGVIGLWGLGMTFWNQEADHRGRYNRGREQINPTKTFCFAGWKAVHLQKRNVFVAKTADFL